jgi:hypothetical protein
VVDKTGDDFVTNMDTAGVTLAFVMMVDAGTLLFSMKPATTVDLQVEYYATLQERHWGPPVRECCGRSSSHRLLSIVSHAVWNLGLGGIG